MAAARSATGIRIRSRQRKLMLSEKVEPSTINKAPEAGRPMNVPARDARIQSARTVVFTSPVVGWEMLK
jgi:hypothetical protein